MMTASSENIHLSDIPSPDIRELIILIFLMIASLYRIPVSGSWYTQPYDPSPIFSIFKPLYIFIDIKNTKR